MASVWLQITDPASINAKAGMIVKKLQVKTSAHLFRVEVFLHEKFSKMVCRSLNSLSFNSYIIELTRALQQAKFDE